MELVSTIIPVYNRPMLLKEAVESVVNQTYRPIEIIIVDDGSTDGTWEQIKKLENQYDRLVRGIRQKNKGPGNARETGRRNARGKYIQYLDSDDLLLPQKFDAQVSALRKTSDTGIAYGKTHHSGIGDKLRDEPFKRTGEKFNFLFPALLQSRWWSTSTPLYRRSVTNRIGPWQNLWNEEDWEYEARAAKLWIKLYYCDTYVSVTRWHNNRLHHQGSTNPMKLRDRAEAHAMIYGYAREAGVRHDTDEMRHFARELFLLSRQCSQAGLSQEGKKLFELARDASGYEQRHGLDFRVYGLIARLVGWRRIGNLASGFERIRKIVR